MTQAARVKAALVKLEQAGERTNKRVTVLEEVLHLPSYPDRRTLTFGT